MIKKRINKCLDVKDGRVVKWIQFKLLRYIGNPVDLE
ncbi:imidazole glycerol phosphate synthase subunit HisF, partial [Staphylococcus aureus]|nr:imidazole glycerol phosphate synthase subunit HisF [Staphylococcus aureus]